MNRPVWVVPLLPRETPLTGHQRTTGRAIMSDANLIQISTEADAALSAFDFAANDGRNSIRIFVQGFG
jgi:hypothetical protein